MARRVGILELAVLGLLHEGPMHGYELRKRLTALLGSLRAFSYGSLYPCLKQMVAQGWIVEDGDADPTAPALGPRRSKTVYRLTAEGKERFQTVLAENGPAAWEDEGFGVRFAFFGRTDAEVRLRILEGRRSRLEERLGGLRASLQRTRERLDGYTLELQRHGLESVEREVRWLSEVIDSERDGAARSGPPPGHPAPAAADAATARPDRDPHGG
ncbi:PadR family transcriptional regulator [Vallicoccus soli]|uniref:PadR family transcriptional regulator n=1 Tax=Vallicoccus soli TaxID=2339232 RepID=A0A3A3YTZ6_9ACTN|nr:PadR family transcriptional regulator [Vallicoccus soli]RJK94165.1 PadR family transcriptional regulator [Vallicoccus soli]